jgi:hypothetical protein
MCGAWFLTWRLLWHFLHCTCFCNWLCNMLDMLTEQDWNHWFGWTQVLCDAFESPASAASKILVWPYQENVGWYVHFIRNHILLIIMMHFQSLVLCHRLLWGGHWCSEGNNACGDTSYHWLQECGLLHLTRMQWSPYIHVGKSCDLWWVAD